MGCIYIYIYVYIYIHIYIYTYIFIYLSPFTVGITILRGCKRQKPRATDDFASNMSAAMLTMKTGHVSWPKELERYPISRPLSCPLTDHGLYWMTYHSDIKIDRHITCIYLSIYLSIYPSIYVSNYVCIYIYTSHDINCVTPFPIISHHLPLYRSVPKCVNPQIIQVMDGHGSVFFNGPLVTWEKSPFQKAAYPSLLGAENNILGVRRVNSRGSWKSPFVRGNSSRKPYLP